MAITIPDTDKPIFHHISCASGGSHEGFYPESKDREDMASQHTASLVMTQLIWVYSIDAEDIFRFLTHMFDRTAKHIAVTFSYVDDKTNLIEIGQTEGEDLDANDELLELRKETWIDMTILDDDNKPSVDRGSGLVYDLDEATDMRSFGTNAYAQRREAKNGKNVWVLQPCWRRLT